MSALGYTTVRAYAAVLEKHSPGEVSGATVGWSKADIRAGHNTLHEAVR